MARIYAPNKEYAGVTAGVNFTNGVGVATDARLLVLFREWGYTVEEEPEKEPEKEPDTQGAGDVGGKTLEEMTDEELRAEAKNMELVGYSKFNKAELLAFILEEVAKRSAENNQ